MSNPSEEYQTAYAELVDIISRLRNSIDLLPISDVDHVGEDDVNTVQRAVDGATDALGELEGLIKFRGRLSPYRATQKILAHAESGGFGNHVKPIKNASDCEQCKTADSMSPSHNGSGACRSGSIASGGTNSHCTCDCCF